MLARRVPLGPASKGNGSATLVRAARDGLGYEARREIGTVVFCRGSRALDTRMGDDVCPPFRVDAPSQKPRTNLSRQSEWSPIPDFGAPKLDGTVLVYAHG